MLEKYGLDLEGVGTRDCKIKLKCKGMGAQAKAQPQTEKGRNISVGEGLPVNSDSHLKRRL